MFIGNVLEHLILQLSIIAQIEFQQAFEHVEQQYCPMIITCLLLKDLVLLLNYSNFD